MNFCGKTAATSANGLLSIFFLAPAYSQVGDGNDVIYGYKSDDTIKIYASNYTQSTVKNDVIIKVGKGSIKLIGAKNKFINIVDYYDPYYSSDKLANSADLIADNNFITNDNQLDSILNADKNYSADKLEMSANDDLTRMILCNRFLHTQKNKII